MDMVKGRGFKKTSGEFGELAVCHWLSRSGFEVAVVDLAGLDLIAYHPKRKMRLGITVKSRTRLPGDEKDAVTLFRRHKNDRQKLVAACKAFNCEPWIAVYVEQEDSADLLITSLENYRRKKLGRTRAGSTQEVWRMDKGSIQAYKDPRANVNHIHVSFTPTHWRW